MKKLSNLSKEKVIIISFFMPFIIFGVIFFVFFDYEETENYDKIYKEINNDSVIKNEIGYVNRFSNSNRVQIRINNDSSEYEKLLIYAKDSKKAIIEFWIDKSEPEWKLDSVKVLQVWQWK